MYPCGVQDAGPHASLLTHAQDGAGQQVSSEQSADAILPASDTALHHHHHREEGRPDHHEHGEDHTK